MICANCQTENRPTANFCDNCGTRLARPCPNCGNNPRPGANFCDNCGFRLSNRPHGVTAGPTRAATERAGPRAPVSAELPGLPEESDRSVAEGERRVVTMLFCDVQGSTAAAGRLDPEDWTRIINGAFEQMIGPIGRYEGTVARLLGDGLLAFFGAPIAHEDDPERAVLAGLDIVAGIERYASQVRSDWQMDIQVRVGINTGLVVVGSYGAAEHLEYSAVGDAINLAARMEQTARPGTVQISEATFRLVAASFEVENLGHINVKGVQEPVPAYRVLGRRTDRVDLSGLTADLTPLVGRNHEMANLRQAVDALRGGRGGIVLLLGETGLGKSRLLRQLHVELEEEIDTTLRWISGSGVSYDSARPYSVFQEFLRQIGEVREPDSTESAGQMGGEHIHHFPLPAEFRRLMAAASSLLPAGGPDGMSSKLGGEGLEGQALKGQLFENMFRALRESARQVPLVGAFDDMHWADPASVELLIHLLGMVTEVPVLFLCALRPLSGQPGWRIKQAAEADYRHRFVELNLAPLTIEESGRLVGELLNASELPEELFKTIMPRTAGNPLFVEAVIRDLVEHGALKRLDGNGAWQISGKLSEITIPEDLQALLASRLDRLERGVRRTLELASVLGATFSARALEGLSDDPGNLSSHLGQLERAGLIIESRREPELEYGFVHHLARDAAYSSILRSRRQELHRRAGLLLENLHASHLEREAHRLAMHFELGQEPAHASRYYSQAGDVAFRLYANEEAVGHYSAALELEKGLEFDVDRLDYLYSRLGRALELLSRFEEALAIYAAMEALAREHDASRLLLQALLLQGQIICVPTAYYDFEAGKALTEQALLMAREEEDRAAEAKVLWLMVNLWRVGGDLEQALTSGRESLAIAREKGLTEQEAFTSNDLAQVYSSLGDPTRALGLYEMAISLWRGLDNRPMLADSLASWSFEALTLGRFDDSLAASNEAFEISRAIDNLWGQSYSRFGPGMVYWQKGDLGKAIMVLEEAIRIGELAGFPPSLLIAGSLIAFIRCDAGQYKEALEIGQKAQTAFEGFRNLGSMVEYALAMAYEGLGQVELARDHWARAETIGKEEVIVELFGGAVGIAMARAAGEYEEAYTLAASRLEHVESHGFAAFRAECLLDVADVLIAMGELEEASAKLAGALVQTRELGSFRKLWQILASQAAIAERQGDLDGARRLRSEAWAAAQYIADHAADDAMRESFLHLPAVRALADADARPDS